MVLLMACSRPIIFRLFICNNACVVRATRFWIAAFHEEFAWLRNLPMPNDIAVDAEISA